jgi:hypothetical protein
VVTDNLDVYETTQVEPLGSELGHIANATRALIVERAVAVRANGCPKLSLPLGQQRKILGIRQLPYDRPGYEKFTRKRLLLLQFIG